MKRLISFLINTVLGISCFAQVNNTSVSYIADLTGVFPNPERGWHNRRDVDGRGGDDDRDFSDVKAATHSFTAICASTISGIQI
jgi:hypothetical protein